MSKVSIYLNYMGNAEEAFNHYKEVFHSEFSGQIFRMSDIPPAPNMPPISEADKHKIMNMSLPILGGTVLMASDMLESLGHKLRIGNNTTISLELDSKEEADRLYKALSSGNNECLALHDEFWGYWGVCLDRFGIRWMFNVMKPQ